jgi:hypothetical protein
LLGTLLRLTEPHEADALTLAWCALNQVFAYVNEANAQVTDVHGHLQMK